MKADVRDQLKRVYFWLWDTLRANQWTISALRKRGIVTIINLHQISPIANPFWSPLHPRYFEELLAFVTRHFRVTTFQQLNEAQDRNRPDLILSFDDGYADFVEYAQPLLYKYRVSANQNIIVDSVRTGAPPTIVRLCDFLGQAPRSLINQIQLPGFSIKLASDDVREKERFGTALCNFLKLRSAREAESLWALLDPVVSRLDSLRLSKMMTIAHVREASTVHEIGAHSASHISFGYESNESFENDLDICERFFASELRLPLNVYSFPNGSHTSEQIQTLVSRGVQHVLLTDEAYSTARSTIHPRFTFWATSREEVHARAVGFTGKIPRMLSLIFGGKRS